MKKLKLGLVGMGFIADWHFQGFKNNPDAEITGMCHNFYGTPAHIEKSKKQLFSKCLEWQIKPYLSFEEMVKDDEFDALIIGSINPYHFEQIKAAFANGKHVLVEKPVVTEFWQLEEINRLSEQTNLKIFPAHNFVYRNSVQKAKEIIDSGKLGQIIHSSFVISHTISEDHATGWRSKKEIAKGGTLIDSGHHLVYQLLYLLGMPSRLQGFTSNMILNNMEVEDTAQLSLNYKDGSIALIMQSWTSNHAEMINGIRIFGTEGSLVITDGLYFNNEKIDEDVEYADSFKNQAMAFTDYILQDKTPLSSLKDVKNTLKIIFDAYDSNENNKVIVYS